MQPQDLVAIRKHLDRAIDDIDYFLGADNKRENAREESGKRYDLMTEFLDKGWTPPKGKTRGKHRLTKTQYNALVHWTTVYGNPLTDEEREAILADLDPEYVELPPISNAGREALAFWARGGWLESSRQATIWLRKAKKTVAADGIDVAMSGLPGKPTDAAERADYREAMRTAAEDVRTILTTALEEQPDSPAKQKKRKRKPDKKREEARQEAKERQAREDAILSEWEGPNNWDSYGDFARWKNENLPDGWDRLEDYDVERAVQNARRRKR